MVDCTSDDATNLCPNQCQRGMFKFLIRNIRISNIGIYLLNINNKCIYHLNLGKDDFGIAKRNVGDTCSFANNPNCFITSESNYNSTCCTYDHPCGIAQGGCETDHDCFDNLECSTDNCGLEANGTKCCQAPGRKPSTLIQLIFMVPNIS